MLGGKAPLKGRVVVSPTESGGAEISVVGVNQRSPKRPSSGRLTSYGADWVEVSEILCSR